MRNRNNFSIIDEISKIKTTFNDNESKYSNDHDDYENKVSDV